MPRFTRSHRVCHPQDQSLTSPRAGFSVPACVGPRLVSAAGLFLYACTPVPAFAQDVSALPGDKASFLYFVWGLSVVALILSVVWLVVQIVRSFRPNPALHQQFAPLNHTHPEFVTRSECKDLMHASMAGDREIIARLDSLDKKVSEGMSRAHARIDPLAEAVAATAKLLDHHLNDHRSPPKG